MQPYLKGKLCSWYVYLNVDEKESVVLVLLKAKPVDISSQKLFKVLPLPDHKKHKSKTWKVISENVKIKQLNRAFSLIILMDHVL